MITTDWKGREDDGRVPFGRKAKLWLALLIRQQLTATDETHPGPVATGQELDDLVEWYCEEPTWYVKWVPTSEFKGRGFSSGGWELDVDVINRDLELGRKLVLICRTREIDNARITSLDEWLRADIDGTLECPGGTGGTDELPPQLIRQLSDAAEDRRKRWPRRCAICGESFEPRKRAARRCDDCIAAGKPANAERSSRRERR